MSTDLPAEVRRESRRSISFPVNTMLQSAVQDGDVAELVRLLCHNDEHDAVDVDVNLPNHIGLTPLHHSVLQNNADAVKLLLCNGADVNAQDKNGFTPLHTAAAGGFYLICSMLIAFGADVTLLTNEGDLCLDLAKEEDMVILLTDATLAQIHSRVYWRGWIEHTLKQLFRIVQRILVHLFTLLKTYWKRRKRKSEKRD